MNHYLLILLFLSLGCLWADQNTSETVTIRLESEPADALIFIKHEQWKERKSMGKTPQTQLVLPKGKIELILLKDQYLPLVEIIDSVPNATFRFRMFKASTESTFQLENIPDFSATAREGFRVYKKISSLIVQAYVEEHSLDYLVEASLRKIITTLNDVRWGRQLIDKAYPDKTKRDKFYEVLGLKPGIDLTGYEPLGYYIKRNQKQVQIFVNTPKSSMFTEMNVGQEDSVYNAFVAVLDFLKKEYDYDGKIKWDILYYLGILGLIDSLDDEHTSFLDPKHWEKTREETKASFGGVGVQVYPNKKDRVLEVISPISDTPAAKAGILPNDRITQVGDVKIADYENPEEAIDLIRGEPGSKIKIFVERTTSNGEIKILSFELVRDIIELIYIQEEILPDHIGYIRITSFMDEHLVDKFQLKYERLLQEGCKGLIIDLRNNPGGLLINALQMADLFIERGTILETRGRLPINNKKTDATASGTYPNNIPIVILVNEGTASASEIVAGALRDHDRAVLVGKKTFGKGSVLELFPISLSNGKKVGLAFTISKYFLPKGECIHKIGITPDHEIDLSEEVRKKVIGRSIYSKEPRDYDDTQLNKAINLLKEKMPR